MRASAVADRARFTSQQTKASPLPPHGLVTANQPARFGAGDGTLALAILALGLFQPVAAQQTTFPMPDTTRRFEGIRNGTITDGAGNSLILKHGKMSPIILDPTGPGSILSDTTAGLASDAAGVVDLQIWCPADQRCGIVTQTGPLAVGATLAPELLSQLQVPSQPGDYVVPVVPEAVEVPALVPDPACDPTNRGDLAACACEASRPVYCTSCPDEPESICPGHAPSSQLA